MIADEIKARIRDIPDFPKEGILFKDITPILLEPGLCEAVVDTFVEQLKGTAVDTILAIESRGFLFGLMLAQRLKVPFIPVRKEGKLPGATVAQSYELEYGSATIEMHQNDLAKGSRVLIHDDLLATGGTASATAALVKKQGSEVAAFSFLITLDFLNGTEKLLPYTSKVVSLVNY